MARLVTDYKIDTPAMRPAIVRARNAKPRLGLAVLDIGKILLIPNAVGSRFPKQFKRAQRSLEAESRLLDAATITIVSPPGL